MPKSSFTREIHSCHIAHYVMCLAPAAQTGKNGTVEIFCGTKLNYRNIFYDKVYELLINLIRGVKWHIIGLNWMVVAQTYTASTISS
ncbi:MULTISPECIES: hypothetical protein [Phocaeicola]|uniref:hypothetical protein n=1 Tax=Phocaeicola TaxID=909656 RepID=UPI00202F6641|nr:hypothetical protein [Phocaeicola massiliensis]MCM1613877.1 hypothetical protein [Phocaeicola massiliensis]MCM1705864.1 hypothetical protein [Phocaeicola massiliensis]